MAQTGHSSSRKKTVRDGTSMQYTKSIIVVATVLIISGVFAFLIIAAALDVTGLSKSGPEIEVTVPLNTSTQGIAEILKKNDLIEYPFLFRVFSKLEHYDGMYQSGTFTLSKKMGYEAMMEAMTDNSARQTIAVTVPEGFTIPQIAALLEEKGICTQGEFFAALDSTDYEFDFLKDVPAKAERPNRVYRLEGYLFPDTYEFYRNSTGPVVVRTFLRNFDNKIDTTMRVAMKASGLTLDDAVTLASIVQGEAANEKHMYKISRVIHNRMDNADIYPQLQCDSTALYPVKLGYDTKSAVGLAYDTYECTGMPAGPINNPGLSALKAAVFPSDDKDMAKYYFFANDSKGNTYYSKTFSEHQAICRKYKIGIYG